VRRRLAFLAVAIPLSFWSCSGSEPVERPYVVSVPYDLDSLDPGHRNRLSDFSILTSFYEPLVATDANLSARPALAQRWSNPDALTWTFELRPGVRFHDGSLLGAEDVVWSFERLRAEPGLELAGHVSAIASVRARGERTVELRTTQPVAILLNKLRFVLIVRRGESGAKLRERVNGTGPYRLAGLEPGREMRLERNEAYWGVHPDLREVRLLLNRAPAEALEDLLSGRSDFVQSNAKATEEALRGRSGFVLRKQGSVSVKFLFVALNREDSRDVVGGTNPFRDVRVRRALSLAIDRAELARRLSAPAIPMSQLVPPGIFGHDPALKALRHDPVEARRLLAEAGWPNGFSLELAARGLFAEAAGIVAEMISEVGIRARVRALPEAAWFRAMHGGLLTLTISRYGCPTGDASDLFENALRTWDPAKRTGLNNYARYSSPEVDRLTDLAGRTLEMSRRQGALREATARALEDLPVIPLYVDQDLYAFREGVAWTPRNDNFLIAAEIARPR
jgi:peptide/nickel transport system substrate-binding protein